MANNGPRNTRSGADEALALGLASGKSVEQAAADAHLSRRTAQRRLQDPAFRARVAELRRELFEQAAGVLAGGVGFAAARLRQLAQTSASEMVVLAACRSVLDFAVRLRDHGELEARLAELEQRLLRKGTA